MRRSPSTELEHCYQALCGLTESHSSEQDALQRQQASAPKAALDAGAPKGFAGAAPKPAEDAPKAGEDIAVLPKAGWEAPPKPVKLNPAELAGVAPKPKLQACRRQ